MHDFGQPSACTSNNDATAREFYHSSSCPRVCTDAVIASSLKQQYPDLELTIIPLNNGGWSCNLLAFAAAGYAKATPAADATNSITAPLLWRTYIAPLRRTESTAGVFADRVVFGKYMFSWKDQEFLMYVVDGRDDVGFGQVVYNHYFLTPPAQKEKVDHLIKAVADVEILLHNEILVFDKGFWQKSAALYNNVMEASWDDVILDRSMKQSLIQDVTRFFDSKERYSKLKVPWKRGVIWHGPPGNGKTVSIKAMMNTLYKRSKPIPSLYVRTFKSAYGSEYSIQAIFAKARAEAPCFLILEDLDSLVQDPIRSYFLNEVDGIINNEGVFIVGSTNHLERLDPGISKRPSRFDRKYYFPKPILAQRVQYCDYWRGKLADNKDIEFPPKLSNAIANITNGFSFAYLQEAFVASLLAIAAHDSKPDGNEDTEAAVTKLARLGFENTPPNTASAISSSSTLFGTGGMILAATYTVADRSATKPSKMVSAVADLDRLILWKEIQKQIKILREEIDDGDE